MILDWKYRPELGLEVSIQDGFELRRRDTLTGKEYGIIWKAGDEQYGCSLFLLGDVPEDEIIEELIGHYKEAQESTT